MARSSLLSSGASLFGTSATKSQTAILVAAGFLFLLALAKFAFQDAVKLEYPANDLAEPWVTSILFLGAKDPYNDTAAFANVWDTAGTSIAYSAILFTYPRMYPPTTLLLIAPLALLHWHTAVYVYLFGSLTLLVLMLAVMARNLPFPPSDPRKLYFVAFALALTPLHFGIVTVNLSTLSIALLCAGGAFMSSRPYLSGAAIGIAVCLKPQLAIFFFMYPWLRRKWKVAFSALAVSAVTAASSLMWLRIHHIEWINGWRSEVARCGTPPGGCTSYTPGVRSLQFLNLQTLAFQFTQNPERSTILSLTLFAVLGLISLFLIVTRISDKNESAGIAIISVLTLLPFYQNFYSGAILLFVLYWAVENWRDTRARATQLCMLLLLVPVFSTLLIRFIANHHLAENVLWNGFVMLHVIWIELAVLILMFVSLYRKPKARSMS